MKRIYSGIFAAFLLVISVLIEKTVTLPGAKHASGLDRAPIAGDGTGTSIAH